MSARPPAPPVVALWRRHGIRTAATVGGVGMAWAALQVSLPRPTPPGIVLQGVVVGGLNALLAVGIVLIYRTNRIVNFAQGELGGAAAVTAVLLVLRAGVPYFAAVTIGLLGAMAVGALIEATVIRRFERAPRLLPTVATIALAQILGFATLYIQGRFGRGRDIDIRDYRSPLADLTFHVDPVPFSGDHLLVVAVVLATAAGLGWFFARTRYGIGIRAAAENPERASLVGIPIRRLSTVVWMLAAALSAAAAMLQAPIVGLTFGRLVGPALLLRALAAAVIGRMRSLPVTVAAAVGLSVLEQALFWAYSQTAIADALLVIVVLVGLLTQRARLSRAEVSEVFSTRAVAEVRPVPAELRSLPEVRWGRWALGAAGTAVAVAVPPLLSVSRVSLVAVVVIWAIVGVSLVTLTGWAGQISLGQFALVGIGAAAAGTTSGEWGLDFILSVLVGGAAGMAAAVALGLPALRMTGFHLAVTTLAFAVATGSWVLTQDWIVPDGIVPRPVLFGRIDLESEYAYYYVCLVALAVVVVLLRGLRRSRVGRSILATRDNLQAAQAYGINATLAKLSAFMVSGGIAGVAGALLVHHQHRLQIDQYQPTESLQAFSMAVIGGLGSVPGAVAGAVFVKGSENILQGPWSLFATGFGLLAFLLALPRGLGSLIFTTRDLILRRLAARRGLVVPSLLADTVAAAGHDDAERHAMAAAAAAAAIGGSARPAPTEEVRV